MHEVKGDAESSGVLLLILLVPITGYGLLIRRRDRREAMAPAPRTQPGVTRSGHGSMLADPLLEFFGPQHARQAPPSQPASRFQPQPGLTGRSTMSAPLATGRSAFDRVSGALPSRTPRSITSAPAEPPAPAGGSVGPIVRRAQVSGAPPWEPAKEPMSDLPWAVVPPQPAAPRPIGQETPAIPPPPDSVWDSAPAARPAHRGDRPRTSAPPPSLFEPMPPGRAPAGPLPAASPAPVPADTGPQPTSWQDLPGAEPQRLPARRRRSAEKKADGERGPIFVWTPMGSNDNKR
jgi:hypothetical protein